jgi:hypothetical protein
MQNSLKIAARLEGKFTLAMIENNALVKVVLLLFFFLFGLNTIYAQTPPACTTTLV